MKRFKHYCLIPPGLSALKCWDMMPWFSNLSTSSMTPNSSGGETGEKYRMCSLPLMTDFACNITTSITSQLGGACYTLLILLKNMNSHASESSSARECDKNR